MKALKDKRKFGWNKIPKNRNCKKFGIQRGGIYKYRNALHILLFHTEGWDRPLITMPGHFDELYWTIKDIKNYYDIYKRGENLFEYITRYEYDPEAFWKTTYGRYYRTLCEHIEELYNTLKLRGDV